ncbi:isocitrate lyase/PEP mutase family protein [Aureibacter tunicatorum]|uniref:2-methylisocitrate lyase-like PEP mutase family enzyme n=1 Tax=Aureibacter tunicatorum TaxID=866807 RepID=A0AAE3XLS8_9BACT|nr:isocitrate lyase/phosphoenolpyruvate mutase family protein [Aureibacter tunicatorum]MDR6238126.1 2-methylisocitrate lyase-like PEP mutase family enzyme [Aureibacter tunicatorum]BDD03159.1 hypothetical protein AUTU_06420 [Aureibacter tunicatorum]
MKKIEQKILAEEFQDLHQKHELFVLPNVWNAGSAVVFEKQGFQALGTTSAGIAYSLGYPDGEKITLNDLCLVVEQIVKRINIPLSVDAERGYGDSPEVAKISVRRIIEAGAVGINIEDGYPEEKPFLENLTLQLEKIQAIKELKKELNMPFVINARTCVFWLGVGKESERMDLALERINAYADAGADCLFVPGVLNEEQSKILALNSPLPLNLIANPVFNDVVKLNAMGVSRLSLGSGPARWTCNKLIKLADHLKKGNDFSALFTHDFSYDKANKYFDF